VALKEEAHNLGILHGNLKAAPAPRKARRALSPYEALRSATSLVSAPSQVGRELLGLARGLANLRQVAAQRDNRLFESQPFRFTLLKEARIINSNSSLVRKEFAHLDALLGRYLAIQRIIE